MGKTVKRLGWILVALYLAAQVLGAGIGAFVAIHYGDEMAGFVAQIAERIDNHVAH